MRWIEQALREVTGRDWSLRIEVDPPSATQEEASAGAVSGGVARRQRREELMKIPLLQRAEEILDARLQEFHADFGSEQPTGEMSDSSET